MRPRRTPPPQAGVRRAALSALVVATVAAAATGCGDAGRLQSAGPTPIASGPVHLWPQRKGATILPPDPGGNPPEYVQGIPRVTRQNVHQVDPLALVKAEIKANGGAASGPIALPAETVRAIEACKTAGAPKCPVLAPYYRDLTGNGRDELIIGIEMPDAQLAVRAYTADPDGRFNRIMGTQDAVISVELAGRDIVLRAPGGNPGYEWITAWSWDEHQRTMLITRDQIVRVTQPRPNGSTGTGSAGTGSTGTGSAGTGSAGTSSTGTGPAGTSSTGTGSAAPGSGAAGPAGEDTSTVPFGPPSSPIASAAAPAPLLTPEASAPAAAR
ncbi:hypothetical protein [Streptomyces sp. NPDC093225]|uniref:hypothetical protein n=1 Tax=Streptomyces sp. NPDC093225 TaxID=3366034 RepID=UPI00382FB0F9